MKAFMDEDFLLSTETAKRLYHEYAEPMPILDYHCHISPKEICEDRTFENITQAWLGGDHYKWRLMRSAGVEERYITGDASDREKFQKWAETLQTAVGNPLYHWSHLELKRYFGFDGHLTAKNAEEVWNLCNAKLKGGLSARKMAGQYGVTLICTTDDPADSLEWHKKMREDPTLKLQVLPAWRPERAMNTAKPDYLDYLGTLGGLAGMRIDSFHSLIEALKVRMDFFSENGCRISDHSLDYVMYAPAPESETERLFAKRLSGDMLTQAEQKAFETMFMLAMGREYAKKGWVMQLHFGVKRNNNQRLYRALGADVGCDSIGDSAPAGQMADFLNALNETGELPRTVLYSLNPGDNAAIVSIIGSFQNSDAVGKLQHGSAWWFNDNKGGMLAQLENLGNLGHLGNFIGMLTDSRSFLSYTRHEYFRRIFCEFVGGLVENGEYPADWGLLEQIVKGVSYNNAVRYFGFDLETK